MQKLWNLYNVLRDDGAPAIEYSERVTHLLFLKMAAERELAELGGDRVVAIEVKATAAPNRRDASHLEWMRAHLGQRFVAGVVFHTGPSAFALAEQITALPIAALWSGGNAA